MTYLANQYHQIIGRQKTSPVQPNTGQQTALRSAFAISAAQWKLLDDPKRLAWSNLALTVPFQGPLGVYYVTGRNLFLGAISLFTYLKTLYQPTLVASYLAPEETGRYQIGPISSIDPLNPGTGFDLNIENAGDKAIVAFIQVSPGFNPSRMRYKGPYDSSKNLTMLCPPHMSHIKPVTGLTAGLRYFWRLRAVTGSTAGIPAIQTVAWQGSHIAVTEAP
jgi:hypothetical protein